MSPECSIIIPVYNAAMTLQKLQGRIDEIMPQTGLSYEVIYINDGSSDGSWEKLKDIKALSSQVRIVDLSNNFGQHKAILCGLTLAKGNFAITIDDDLQIPPEEIPKLIEVYQEGSHDIVYGIYSDKKHAWYRNIGSRSVAMLLNRFAESGGRGSSFKLISRDLIDKITTSRFEYIFLDEIIAWHTNKIAYVVVEHREREDGKSGYSFGKLLVFTFRIIFNYTIIPLHLMTLFGVIVAFSCFCLGIYYIYDKIANDVQLGYTSIIVTIFFATGVIMFSLGIIGQYIRRLYYTQLYKPPFKIREILE